MSAPAPGTPVLEIAGALPRAEEESPLAAPVDLRLAAGEVAVVEAPDAALGRALVELCAGLPRLAQGRVRLLGQDLAGLPRRAAEALRGRIGIAAGEGGWLPHLPVEAGMLLPSRHHGAQQAAGLRQEAEALARHFGLEGVPQATPHELSHLDLARAALARAFLGHPALLLLESPRDAETADALAAPLRAMLLRVLAEGAAALWTTRSRLAWDGPAPPSAQHLRLSPEGLARA